MYKFLLLLVMLGCNQESQSEQKFWQHFSKIEETILIGDAAALRTFRFEDQVGPGKRLPAVGVDYPAFKDLGWYFFCFRGGRGKDQDFPVSFHKTQRVSLENIIQVLTYTDFLPRYGDHFLNLNFITI